LNAVYLVSNTDVAHSDPCFKYIGHVSLQLKETCWLKYLKMD